MTTALAEDELLAEARLPLLAGGCPRSASTNSAGAPAISRIAMALVTYRLEDGVIVEPRVGVGGAETQPRRIAEAEAALDGQPPTDDAFRAAAEAAAAAIDPMEDMQANAEYRRDLVRAVTRRALERCRRMSAPTQRDEHDAGTLGRPLDPAARGSGAGHRARPLHRRPAGGALGALRAQPGGVPAASSASSAPDGATVVTAADLQGVEADPADAAQVQLRAGRPADPRRRRRALRRRADRRRGRGERGGGRGHRRAGRGRHRADGRRSSMRAHALAPGAPRVHAEAPANVIVEGRVKTPDFDAASRRGRTSRRDRRALAPAERDCRWRRAPRMPPSTPRPAASRSPARRRCRT